MDPEASVKLRKRVKELEGNLEQFREEVKEQSGEIVALLRALKREREEEMENENTTKFKKDETEKEVIPTTMPASVPPMAQVSTDQFPCKQAFAEIMNLPQAIKLYRGWCEANSIPAVHGISGLMVLLPTKWQTCWGVMKRKPQLSAQDWEAHEATILEVAGKVVGTRKISEALSSIRVGLDDCITEIYGKLLDICRLECPRDPAAAETRAMDQVLRKLPAGIRSRALQNKDKSDQGNLLLAIQGEMDISCDAASEYPVVGAVCSEPPKEATFRVFYENEPVKIRIDHGAEVSFIGANSALGSIIGKLPKERSPTEWVTSPAFGGQLKKVLWAVPANFKFECEDPKKGRWTKTLTILVYGMDGENLDTLYIGEPTLDEWGTNIDVSSKRVGIRALRQSDKDHVPWFSNPSVRGKENGITRGPSTGTFGGKEFNTKVGGYNSQPRRYTNPRNQGERAPYPPRPFRSTQDNRNAANIPQAPTKKFSRNTKRNHEQYAKKAN